MNAARVVPVFCAPVELDADALSQESAIDEVAVPMGPHLDLRAGAGESSRAQLVEQPRLAGGGASGIRVGDDPLRLRAAPRPVAQLFQLLLKKELPGLLVVS